MRYMYRCPSCGERKLTDIKKEILCEKCQATTLKLTEVNLSECDLSEIEDAILSEKERRSLNETTDVTYLLLTPNGSKVSLSMYSEEALNKTLQLVQEQRAEKRAKANSKIDKYNMVMPFGKHKDKLITELPDSYVAWLLAQDINGTLKMALEEMVWNDIKQDCLKNWIQQQGVRLNGK